jgi:hypothetical protein
VVKIGMPVKARLDGKRKRDVPLNLVRTASQMAPNALRDRTRYVLVWGRLE